MTAPGRWATEFVAMRAGWCMALLHAAARVGADGLEVRRTFWGEARCHASLSIDLPASGALEGGAPAEP